MTKKAVAISQHQAEIFNSWVGENRAAIGSISVELNKFDRVSTYRQPNFRLVKDFYQYINNVSHSLLDYLGSAETLEKSGLTTLDDRGLERLESLINAYLKLTGYASIMATSFSEMLSELDTWDEEEAQPYIRSVDRIRDFLEERCNEACDMALELFDPDKL